MKTAIERRLTKTQQAGLIKDIEENGKGIAFTKWGISRGSSESLDKFLIRKTGESNHAICKPVQNPEPDNSKLRGRLIRNERV